MGGCYILNSAGITFTGTSQVNVGALLATTAMTVNGDPTQAASYSGLGYGAVINQGSISVSNGGFAILAAPYVQNTGFIKADLGTIALAGTNQFTLDLPARPDQLRGPGGCGREDRERRQGGRCRQLAAPCRRVPARC